MVYGNRVALLLLLTFFAAADSQRGKLGGSCAYDDGCAARFSFCRNQYTCECKPGYRPNKSKDDCVATIRTACFYDDDCTTLANSECVNGVCTCLLTHHLDSNEECILSPVKPTKKPKKSAATHLEVVSIASILTVTLGLAVFN